MEEFKFVNKKFRLLALLYAKQDKDGCANITQAELGEQLSLNRNTVGKMLAELAEGEYVSANNKHPGRYHVSEKACRLVEQILGKAREGEF